MEHDGGDNDDNDNDDGVNIDVVEDDDDDGTTTMRWRRGRMDDDDAMVMGGQRHAERLQAPRHPSEATINLCQQFGEESTRERDDFGHMLECTLKTSATSFHYLNIDEE